MKDSLNSPLLALLQTGDKSTWFVFCEKGDCPKGSASDHWHPLECSLHQRGNCKLGSKCALKGTEKAWVEPKKRNNSVVVAKILDHTQAEENHFTRAKEDLVYGVSTIPAKSVSQNIGKNVAKKFRLVRVAERFVTERQKRCPTLAIIRTRWAKRSKSEYSVARATRKLCRCCWGKHGICSRESTGRV